MTQDQDQHQDQAIRHVLVRGRVQGVGYRAWAEMAARERGLGGWVRNRRDGAVEAVFAGDASIVETILAACRRGPPAARVDEVAELAAEPQLLDLRRPGERFSVLATA